MVLPANFFMMIMIICIVNTHGINVQKPFSLHSSSSFRNKKLMSHLKNKRSELDDKTIIQVFGKSMGSGKQSLEALKSIMIGRVCLLRNSEKSEIMLVSHYSSVFTDVLITI